MNSEYRMSDYLENVLWIEIEHLDAAEVRMLRSCIDNFLEHASYEHDEDDDE